MAHLIIVHRDHDEEEILVNADRIIWCERVRSQARSYTNIKLTDDQHFTIRETLSDLEDLCRRSV